MSQDLRTAAASLSDLALHYGDARLVEAAQAVRNALATDDDAAQYLGEPTSLVYHAYEPPFLYWTREQALAAVKRALAAQQAAPQPSEAS